MFMVCCFNWSPHQKFRIPTELTHHLHARNTWLLSPPLHTLSDFFFFISSWFLLYFIIWRGFFCLQPFKVSLIQRRGHTKPVPFLLCVCVSFKKLCSILESWPFTSCSALNTVLLFHITIKCFFLWNWPIEKKRFLFKLWTFVDCWKVLIFWTFFGWKIRQFGHLGRRSVLLEFNFVLLLSFWKEFDAILSYWSISNFFFDQLRGFHVVHNSNGGKCKLVRVCCDFAFHSREIRFFHKKPVQIFNYFSNCWASLSST